MFAEFESDSAPDTFMVFAIIFANNSTKNGFLTVTLREDEVAELTRRAQDKNDYHLTVDLEQCRELGVGHASDLPKIAGVKAGKKEEKMGWRASDTRCR